MKKRRDSLKEFLFQKRSVYTISLLLFAFLIYTWYHIHIHTTEVCAMLDDLRAKPQAPIGADNLSIPDNNSDFIFKFHQSRNSTINLLIAIIGILVTYTAFYIQYLFNERQKHDLSSERFENQYFHFLDVYREICKSTALANVGSGKIVFHYMFYEYKALYRIVQIYVEENISKKWSYEQINNLTFTIFINGISRDILLTISDPEITPERQIEIRDILFVYQTASEQHGTNGYVDNGVTYLKDYMTKHIKYFDGHRFRLIPYFKYVFMIIDHVINLDDKTESQKFEILKYFFCEMSEHEIGLIYAYTHYNGVDNKYIPYLNRLYSELPPNMAHKFKFDNKNFIAFDKISGGTPVRIDLEKTESIQSSES